MRDQSGGLIDHYGAQAIAKLTPGAVPVTGGKAQIILDNFNYEGAPVRFLAPVQDPSHSEQRLIFASISGDLWTGLTPISQIGAGVLYRADEKPASFQPSLGTACFLDVPLNDQTIRLVPNRLSGFLKDSYGYLKVYTTSPALGLLLSRQGAGGNLNRWAGIHSLHKSGPVNALLLMPVLTPHC